MDELNADQFAAFFRELYDYDPFPWQKRLAMDVCTEGWPAVLDLPTASGKTACIDVAVFAMAVHLRGPRRVFFVVDRRVVVDAAFERMKHIADRLRVASGGVLKAVANRLRYMARGDEPLDTYQMRGGIYRDNSWVRSPLQPTLIASTVDQVGSRLLFRGYGVWDNTLPIHAGLVANDALVFLDEAHCSRPFSETLAAVQRHRGGDWAAQDSQTPFSFVEMTATPAGSSNARFSLEEEDYRHPELRKRLYAAKPTKLIVSKARAKDFEKVAKTLVEEAVGLAKEPGLRRIGLIVNRVKTARLAYAALAERGCRVHLLIGRMRPVDRLELPPDVTAMLSGNPRTSDSGPVFIVATQCLEVGADLDFDAIVTECASIDALLQRFGRLDRIGALYESGVTSQGRVVIASLMSDPKYRDPIYGEALAKTWKWLNDAAEDPDFGICSEGGTRTVRERLQFAVEAGGLRREAASAPVLLPAHLDVLVQTSPRPALEPDIYLYLHGMENGSPEVQVVWRADLNIENPVEQWAEIVSLCPPVSAEAMGVPLREFRAWLTQSWDGGAVASDVEGVDEEIQEEGDGQLRCKALCWRGDKSDPINDVTDARKIRPGDTLILAEASGGWNELGHIPPDAPVDAAERARLALRRWVLRLHPALLRRWPESPTRERLIELAKQPAVETDELVQAIRDYKDELKTGPVWLVETLNGVPRRPELEAYPGDDGAPVGWVLTQRFAEADSGDDESSASEPVRLDEHLADVTAAVTETAQSLIDSMKTQQSLVRAAQFHDYGKADPRFQALLHGGDRMAAQFAPRLLAKGRVARQSRQVRKEQFVRSGLPDGFRHELISLLLAREAPEIACDDLALHLIASHHGRCRPFAPVVEDSGGDLAYNGRHITREERLEKAAHRLDSGVADRFWRLTRLYGWWGLAYLESVFRLGDWKTSQLEEKARESRR
jgi:CRISPR-associated endonuclease/helicase Cas3